MEKGAQRPERTICREVGNLGVLKRVSQQTGHVLMLQSSLKLLAQDWFG